jgi:hypothetical protein
VGGSSLFAAEPIVRVEEDWELHLKDPNPSTEAPQVTCLISPLGHTRDAHVAFELNHRTQPDYEAGGLQLQLWKGSKLLDHKSAPHRDLLATSGETVRWTQQMQLQEGRLVIQVVNGESETWGHFGIGHLRVSVDSPLTSLDSYRPCVSIENSGVGYAGNRVAELILKEIRLYSPDGLLGTWSVPTTAHKDD